MKFELIKSIHLLSIFLVFASLFAEWVLLRLSDSKFQFKYLARIDAIYGLSALCLLVSGFYLALFLGKGRDFYFDNGAIYIKLFVFLFIGLLSIYPTIFFIKNRKIEDQNIGIPKSISRLVTIELILLLLLPYFAVLLANGTQI